MTAKRWEIIDEEFISYTGGTAQLISNGECEIRLWETPKDAQLFCDKLNALYDENEQLKEDNLLLIDDSEKYRKLSIQFDNRNKKLVMKNALLEKENEQLKQYIYDNIDENICEVCSYQYLEKHSQMQGYYVARCKKGYDNCSKGTVIHCKDFKFKELNVND